VEKAGGRRDGYAPIGDYAVIGDCRGAALVARDGAIDWLAWPRFDSPSIFAALLDAERGGTFRVRPTAPYRVSRRYLPATNVLETGFVTAAGACVLRDLMPVASDDDARRMYMPEHELLREIEGVEGEVELEIFYDPRPDYGRTRVRLHDRGALGLWCEAGGGALYLRADLPGRLEIAPNGASAAAVVTIAAGRRVYLSLGFAREGPAVVPPLGEAARARLQRATYWWETWAGGCRYEGPYREAVVRSALALKLLTFAPSGAIVAAPTTSLPEQIGGDKNWDYRYCWLRDAAFTLRALHRLRFDAEARAFHDWLLHATRLSWPRLEVLYDVYGRNSTPERELAHLAGYARSRPVRVGNLAQRQLQLDVYGEVTDAALQHVRHGGALDRDAVKLLRGIGELVCDRWREPDSGIWEARGARRHYTHAKVLCWVALDRLITLRDRHRVDIPVNRLLAERGTLRAEIEARGFNERLGSYTATFGGDDLDASLLALPLYGYVDAGHLRMRSTLARIQERLGAGPDGELLYRNLPPDGTPDEGTFGICAFWAVECQARAGDLDGAVARFERLLAYANDVGLFAEEIDPRTGAALGNVPQGFTHVGLINAAVTLDELQQKRAGRLTRARAGGQQAGARP
jgi:GH15 family glucan-1,4-alpha-glucosidase